MKKRLHVRHIAVLPVDGLVLCVGRMPLIPFAPAMPRGVSLRVLGNKPEVLSFPYSICLHEIGR